ncbi:unnamed protein product [Rotaria socialis]|uniref:Cytochrome P450 n=1 Tax=Rotaria socialis TaxID=392032 RepID=A0A821IP94_9BILA|nr:unnamed protein product [Rotaria socialis]
MLWSAKSLSKQLKEWTGQYGSIYRLFIGTTPMYVVSDVIKQFSSFRSPFGSRWRRQRHATNPTFSSAKLKLMSPLVSGRIEAMLNKISTMTTTQHKEINMYELYKRLTMDVICNRCVFGIDMDMQNDIHHPYLLKSAEVFKTDADHMLLMQFSNFIPSLARPLHDILFSTAEFRRRLIKATPVLSNFITELPRLWLINRVREVVNQRVKSSSNTKERVDDTADDHVAAKVLKFEELIPNIFLFMVAGDETTSTALSSRTFFSALDMRGPQVWSIIAHDFLAQDKSLSSPKGLNIIQPDVFSIHYDPDLWGSEDPNLFIPERHLVKSHAICINGIENVFN